MTERSAPVVDDRIPVAGPGEGWVSAPKLDVVDSLGNRGTIDAGDAQAFVAKGGHVVSHAEKLDERYGSGAGQFATFGLGGIQGLTLGTGLGKTLGLVSAIGGEQAARDVREAAREAKEANPYAYLGGELAGMVAQSAVVPGGGVYGALGGAVEKGALGGLARVGLATGKEAGLGANVLGKAIAGAARGTAETSLMNVQSAITEATLGDHEINGQKLFAAATDKDALLLGAGAGGAFGAAAGAIESLGAKMLGKSGLVKDTPGPRPKEALDAVAGVEGAGAATRAEAQATETILADAQRAGMTTEHAKVVIGDLDTMAAQGAKTERGIMDAAADAYAKAKSGGNADTEAFLKRVWEQRSGKVAVGIDDMDALTRRVVGAGDRVLKTVDETLAEAMFAEKPTHMAKLVDESKLLVARDAAITTAQDLKATLAQLGELKTAGATVEGVAKSSKQLERLGTRLEKAGEMSAGELFTTLDEIKRAVGKNSGFGQERFLPTEAQKEMQGLYQKLRTQLEDEAVWGKAGAAQRDMNAATSQALATRRTFEDRFTTLYGQTEMGRATRVMDGARAKGFLGQVGGAEADIAEQSAKDFIAGMRNRANAAEQHLDLTAAQKSHIAEGRKALDELEATLAKTKDEAAIANRIKAAQAEETSRGLGGVIGFAVDTVSSPLKTIDRMASIHRTLQRIDAGIDSAVGKAVRGEIKGPVADIVNLTGKARTRIVQEIEQVTGLRGNPAAIQERTRALTGDLPGVAPKTAGAVAATAARMVDYLGQIAPIGVVQLSLAGKKKVVYNDEDLARYARVSAALKNPEAVVESAAHGRMSGDQIKAMKFVFPSHYEQIRQTAIRHIAQLELDGKLDDMPYDQKAQMAAMLGVKADPSTSGEFTASMQLSKAPIQPAPAQGPGAARPRGAPSSVKASWGSRMGTESDRLASGGSAS